MIMDSGTYNRLTVLNVYKILYWSEIYTDIYTVLYCDSLTQLCVLDWVIVLSFFLLCDCLRIFRTKLKSGTGSSSYKLKIHYFHSNKKTKWLLWVFSGMLTTRRYSLSVYNTRYCRWLLDYKGKSNSHSLYSNRLILCSPSKILSILLSILLRHWEWLPPPKPPGENST